jgi:hypothetical protein
VVRAVKSRPSFRPLLSEWLAGVPASRTYVDLDFEHERKLAPDEVKVAGARSRRAWFRSPA